MATHIWTLKALGRVLANALMGALLTMVSGALSVCIAGAMIAGITLGEPSLGAIIGLLVGAPAGLVGFVIFGIAAVRPHAGHTLQPTADLMLEVVRGQWVATALAFGSFFIVEIVRALVLGQTFARLIDSDLIIVLFATPATMICGAIVGALWKRD